MALAYDTLTALTESTATPTISGSHTPIGTPRAVVVYIYGAATTSDQVDGVTYGGVSMTEVTGSPVLDSGGDSGSLYAYFLGASIPTGEQTVEVTTSGTSEKLVVILTLTGANDTEIVDSDTMDNDSISNPSLTLSPGGVDCFITFVGMSGATGDPGARTGYTQRHTSTYTTSRRYLTYTKDALSSTDVTDVGWDQSADDANMIALAIRESAGGGGVTTIPPAMQRLMRGFSGHIVARMGGHRA